MPHVLPTVVVAAAPAAEPPTEAPAAEALAEARAEARAAARAKRQAEEICSAGAVEQGSAEIAKDLLQDLPAEELENLLRGFARILRRGFGVETVDDEDRTCFHANTVPKVSLEFYFERIRSNLPCGVGCFVAALVYMDRVARRDGRAAATEWTSHRLSLTAVMLAYRFWEDPDEVDYPAAWFAKLGGIKLAEIGALESNFLNLLDWRLHVHPDEFLQYLEKLREAASDSTGDVPKLEH